MCGIAGLVLEQSSDPTATAQRFLSELAHRGPDASGWVHLGGHGPGTSGAQGTSVVLAHTRLAIIDLSNAGAQPMASAGGRYQIVFNGEIYNYRELAAELQGLGHNFRTRSDTEVLLEAFAEWGPAALPRLVGMFAFAVSDTWTNRIYLARDPFGMKPLFFARTRMGLAFASEIKALTGLPGVSRQANNQRFFDYLRFGLTDHGAETMFADITQVPAAHYLEIDPDSPLPAAPVRYWQVPRLTAGELSFDAAAEQLRELFLESVSLHLRSDVAVGCALSGGIDSSSILGVIRHLQGTAADIHAFHYSAGEGAADEQRWAGMAARAAGATLHVVRIDDRELTRDIDMLIAAQDEPFGSTSIFAQYRVFQEARRNGVKVLLDGQGADELLAGYPFYTPARMADCIRGFRWWEAAGRLRRLPPGERRRAVEMAGGHLLPRRLHGLARRLGRAEASLPAWIDSGWVAEHGVVVTAPWLTEGRSSLRSALRRSLTETSLPMLLRYEDRNSMAHSVESRLPFLTPDLAAFVSSLPDEYLIDRQGTTKAIFRRAMRGLVPEAILARRDKIGFETPEATWLSNQETWIEQVLASETARHIPALLQSEMIATWRTSRKSAEGQDARIWRWVNAIKWVERFQVTFG